MNGVWQVVSRKARTIQRSQISRNVRGLVEKHPISRLRTDINRSARIGNIEFVPFDVAILEKKFCACRDAAIAAMAGEHNLTRAGKSGLPRQATAVRADTPGTECLNAVTHDRSESI